MSEVWSAITKGPRHWAPSVFYVYDLLVVLLLLLVSPFFASSWDGPFTNPFRDVLPTVVPWAGALGGVAISLVGVAGHSIKADWRPDRYGYWHLSRPLLGAVFGTVAVLIVVLLVHSIDVQGSGTSTGYPLSGQLTLGVIAFVVGYREETFRTLVRRVVDLIVAPGGDAAGTSPIAFVPGVLDFGQVSNGTSKSLTTSLFNASRDTVHVDSGALTASSGEVQVAIDPAATTDLAAGASLVVTVTWSPTKAGTTLDGELKATLATSIVTAAMRGTST